METPAISKPATGILKELKIVFSRGGRPSSNCIGASLFVALCARITLAAFLPFTPVPILTLQNFGGAARRARSGPQSSAFAALALYLGEGLRGMPVTQSHGTNGTAYQLLGPNAAGCWPILVAGIAG